jgi:L-ribulose-5-phosphate 4-epimerase
MDYDELREQVCKANKQVVEAGLVLLTWGNVSGVDRHAGVLAIKPSGVGYDALTPDDIVIVSIETGETVEGVLRPSSDTESHRVLYQNFPNIGGIVHTHSTYATSFAQAQREIPCLGTTHADHFYGAIPVTRPLQKKEIKQQYEWNTGEVIVECFREGEIDPDQMPAVLVANHGPFAWGRSVTAAVENAIVLEASGRMAWLTYGINPKAKPISQELLDKHYLRKHGDNAYYGQQPTDTHKS